MKNKKKKIIHKGSQNVKFEKLMDQEFMKRISDDLLKAFDQSSTILTGSSTGQMEDPSYIMKVGTEQIKPYISGETYSFLKFIGNNYTVPLLLTIPGMGNIFKKVVTDIDSNASGDIMAPYKDFCNGIDSIAQDMISVLITNGTLKSMDYLIKNENLIDMTAFTKDSDKMDMKWDIIVEKVRKAIDLDHDALFYYMIPPYYDGIVNVYDHMYVQYKVTEVNIPEKILRISFKEFPSEMIDDPESMAYDSVLNHYLFEYHLCCKVDGAKVKCEIDTTNMQFPFVSCAGIDVATEMNYDRDKTLLTNYCARLSFTSFAIIDFYRGKFYTEFKHLQEVLKLFVAVNVSLSEGSPRATSYRHRQPAECQVAEILDPHKHQPKMVTRKMNDFVFRSEKPPTRQTRDTIIKYKMANWQRRGHIRHYSNGHNVYIRPTIAHRHILEECNVKTVPSVHVISGKEEQEDDYKEEVG